MMIQYEEDYKEYKQYANMFLHVKTLLESK